MKRDSRHFIKSIVVKIKTDGRLLFIKSHITDFSPKRYSYIPVKIEKVETHSR